MSCPVPSVVLGSKKRCGGLSGRSVRFHSDQCGRSLRWLDRCLSAHSRPTEQSLFPIVQGGLDEQLREQSVKGNLLSWSID